MANTYSSNMEKVTFNIPIDVKEQVLLLKDELKVSLSSIYNDAIVSYLKQKELAKWEKGVSLALADAEYISHLKEFSSDDGDVYEY
jgi:hypothetical protein